MVTIDAPSTSVNEINTYSNDASATSVLTGMYTAMSLESSVFTGLNGISLLAGLSADEWKLLDGINNARLVAYYQNGLSVNLSYGSEPWIALYKEIYKANAAIEGLVRSTELTESTKLQLLGEAKFLRGFYYFYLVNLYGDVPLVITTDYKENSVISRSAISNIYSQILEDLKEAETLLSSTYLDGNLKPYSSKVQRVRPTKWAAIAMLARTYLYLKDYGNAEKYASQLINNTSDYGLGSINNVFLSTSKEAIWQLQPVTLEHNTGDGWIFNIPTTGPDNEHPVYFTKSFLSKFESADKRKDSGNWINKIIVNSIEYYYPYKYKSALKNAPLTEYLMVLRLAEQYLIRAEARLYLNDLMGVKNDLNILRARAGLIGTSFNDKNNLLVAIFQERRNELFTEWGHRWFDLKRSNAINDTMNLATSLKGGVWNSFKQLYPLPLDDIKRNRNLIQNPEY